MSLPSGPKAATAACCSMGRCVLPSKKNVSSRTWSASREALLHVAEVERDLLVHVAVRAVVVDARVRPGERLLDRHERRQHLVVDVDERQRRLRRLLVQRGHRGHRIAHEADLVRGRARARPGSRAGCRTGWAARRPPAWPARPGGRPPARRRSRGCARAGAASAAASRRPCAAARGRRRRRLARDLGRGVHLGQRLADDVVSLRAQPRVTSRLGARAAHGALAAHPRGRQLDRLEDLQVAGAAAEVAGEGLRDLLPRGRRLLARAAPRAASRKPGVQ